MGLFSFFGFSSRKGKSNNPPGIISAQREELRQSKGRLGKAATKLRLTGYVLVDGKRREAISTKLFVEEGRAIRVVGERFGRLLVEPV
ncbi:MAG: hypothetical protein AAF824_18840 [Bacteroidota bacterium]